MIKFIQCVRKKPELETAEFRRYWQRYAAAAGVLAEVLNARRCAESMTLAVEANLNVMMTRGTAHPYDAVMEIWVDSAAHVAQVLQSEVGLRAVADLRELQTEFIDLGQSSFFFTSEQVVFESP